MVFRVYEKNNLQLYFRNPKTSFYVCLYCSSIPYLHTFVCPTLTCRLPLLPYSVSAVEKWTWRRHGLRVVLLRGGADLPQPPQQPVQRLHVLRLLLQQLVAQAGDVLLDLLQLA